MDSNVTLENVELSDIYDRPELITSLLYKKLLQKIDEAIELIPRRQYDQVNRSLQLCNDIITRLGFGIKYEAGVLADQLEMLYHYMHDRIYEANFRKNVDILREIRDMVKELDEAWTIAMAQKEENGNISAVMEQTSKALRFNPYQKREMDQEIYQYEKEKQEIHIKK